MFLLHKFAIVKNDVFVAKSIERYLAVAASTPTYSSLAVTRSGRVASNMLKNLFKFGYLAISSKTGSTTLSKLGLF